MNNTNKNVRINTAIFIYINSYRKIFQRKSNK